MDPYDDMMDLGGSVDQFVSALGGTGSWMNGMDEWMDGMMKLDWRCMDHGKSWLFR
jgi:hypothetical protein